MRGWRRAGAKGAPARGASDDADLSRDTVASVLRTLGEYALPTAAFPPDEFARRCESLAVAVLVERSGERVDAGEPAPPRVTHGEIRRLAREQRAAESTAYRAHRESAQILVSGLVDQLRATLAEAREQDEQVLALLDSIREAVDSGEVDAIRSAAARAAARIRVVLTQRRRRDEDQLRALGDKLREMRTELDATREKASRDGLTDLLNRGAFDEALEGNLRYALATGRPLALYLVDVDHFKEVNDRHGHAAGDAALTAVARTLATTFLRKDDVLARFGGDEYAALCPDMGDPDDAHRVAERARAAVAEAPVLTDAGPVPVTLSIGFAVSTGEDTPASLLRRADEALYEAKRAGRNTVAPPP